MIEKIKGLSIQGRCFPPGTKLDLFPNEKDRAAIIFGRNGSGKSTISMGIDRMVHADDSTELSASFYDYAGNQVTVSPDSHSLFVYNEDYVRRNLSIGEDGLHTIVYLGEQVDIKEDLDRCLDRARHAREELEKVEKALNTETGGNLSPERFYNEVMNALRTGGWAERDRDIKGNKANTGVRDSVVERICEKTKVSTGDTAEALRSQFNEKMDLLKRISSNTGSYPQTIQPIQWNNGTEETICSGLSKAVEKPIWTERERQIFAVVEKYNLPFVRMAQTTFGREKTTVCPYCYQDVSAEYKKGLLESINRVLNRDAEAHERELRDWDQALESLARNLLSESARRCFDLDPALWKTIASLEKRILETIGHYRTAVSQKLNNVYQAVDIPPLGLEDALTNMNALLRQMEEKRVEFNKAAQRAGQLKRELTAINDKMAHIQTDSVYASYKQQLKRRGELTKEYETWNGELSKCNSEENRLNQKRSNARQASVMINKELEYVFFSRDRFSLELAADTSGMTERYILKSNGEDVKPGSISTGERNIIALCYFFAKTLSNQSASDFYRKEALFLIDDPISSFDFENRIGILTLLRYQIDKILTGNSTSKVIILSHDLVTVFDSQKALDEISKFSLKLGNKTKLYPYAVYELSESTRTLTRKSSPSKEWNEYKNLLKRIYSYADGQEVEADFAIGNEMRRVLETYSTFFYQKSIEEVSLDKDIQDCLGHDAEYFKNLMYRLVLHGESHFGGQIKSLRDNAHFFEFISKDEKRKTAQKILLFMYLLNPLHIKAYLEEESWLQKIEQWKNDLSDEYKQDSKHMPDSGAVARIIPLFYLPLSAGPGNIVFDDSMPHEDYETENNVCDFALSVSGSSMEPDIPDGSIVLIRRTEELAEGKIGAFFLDGNVYCKKFHRNSDGSVLLESLNPEFPNFTVGEDSRIDVYGEVVEIIPPDDE